ncbi:transcription factor BEE 3-like isoform X5 [Cucurbita pepo subsp. pepo]|uniref:transcription factor BEE 3-like isoform X5 n=1 Tax=Cucurbita pepo subsp. pepo TaxID=3664 RepID=UPI000C9D847F|nr:transcription factor BEE 3-like isoform X5 [Cucurbita pepo subsp. pepo]
MIEFRQDLHHFKSSKASEERGLNMEVINQFPNMTESMLEDFNQTDFSEENFLGYHFQLSENTTRSSISDFPRLALFKCQSEFPVITRSSPLVDSSQETMNRKAEQVLNLGGRKRRKCEKEQEKPAEVVHIRAKRGEATHSHSLAERVRREKINNKLKCLQNLVPGCHETMGMTMVLDETITYVHSLQNQVEFLSMELATACSTLGINSGMGATRKASVIQQLPERVLTFDILLSNIKNKT